MLRKLLMFQSGFSSVGYVTFITIESGLISSFKKAMPVLNRCFKG